MRITLKTTLLFLLLSGATLTGCGDGASVGYDDEPGPGLTPDLVGDPAPDCSAGFTCVATATNYAGFGEWPLYDEGKDQRTYFYGPDRIPEDFVLVATPFAIQLSQHGSSREEYIRAVINDAKCGRPDCDAPEGEGAESPGLCFEIQDPRYEGKLLVPQEFCGGNGWPVDPTTAEPSAWDVQNNCELIQSAYAAGQAGLVGLCQPPVSDSCKALCYLADVQDRKPAWRDLDVTENMQDFIDAGSCKPPTFRDEAPSYTNPDAANFRAACADGNQPNWCTGKHMHFDGLNYGDLSGKEVRYNQVHCNKNGSRDVGHLGPKIVPPPTPENDQLVIFFTLGRFSSLACDARNSRQEPIGSTTVNSATTTPIANSQEADSVVCYRNGTNFTFTHDLSGKSWASSTPDVPCKDTSEVPGSKTCTVNNPQEP